MKPKLTGWAKAAMFFFLPMSVSVLLMGIFIESPSATFFRYFGIGLTSFWIPTIIWELTISGYLPLKRRTLNRGSKDGRR